MEAEYMHRKGSSRIETLNGHFVDPLNMRPEDVRIGDIAHALSNQNRFNGYTSRPYSVAEHSVYVARVVARMYDNAGTSAVMGLTEDIFDRRSITRQALLHDATEAYLLDIPRPVKLAIPAYGEIEARLWEVIAGVFDVPVEMHPFVKEADRRLCHTEKLAFLSPEGLDKPEWAIARDFPPYKGDWDIIDRYSVPAGVVRRRFLDMFDQVKP